MIRHPESSPPAKMVLTLCLIVASFLAGLWLPASTQDEEFNQSVQIIVETLNFLGDEALANRLLDDIQKKRVRLGKLDPGKNATTGTSNLLGIGENEMILDESVLVLGKSEILWKKKKFDCSLNYLGWAETIVHEYVHMDQKDPINFPKFEDPAYLQIARTHVRWFNRLSKIFAMISAGEQDPAKKAAKLRGLREILNHLHSLQGAFFEAVDGKIQDRSLNPHLPFANEGLDARILNLMQQIDTELKATEAQPAPGKTDAAGAPAGPSAPATTAGRPGWHQDGAPQIEKSVPKPDACYPNASLNIAGGAATGIREWTDCSNATKCSGTYVGKVTWTPPPAFLEPGQELQMDATAGTTAQNTCGYRNFSSGLFVKMNGATFVQAGESQYSGPPKATGKRTIPGGQPGARLTIEVFLQAASLNGKVVYSYVYR